MLRERKTVRILVVGDDASPARAGLRPDTGLDIEVVGTLAEAAARQAAGGYARVIVDPSAFDGSASLEILACPAEPDSPAQLSEQVSPSVPASLDTSIFDLLNDAVLIHTEDVPGRPGKFTYANAIACAKIGYTRAELLEKGPLDVLSGDELAAVPALAEELHRTGRLVVEKRIDAKNGEKIPFEISHTLFDRDGHTMVVNIARDLREREHANQALRESEERFRAFVAASSDVVYRMNADWTEMRHLDGKQFIADTDSPTGSWLERYIHPDDQPRVMEAVREAIRNKSVFELENRVLRPDGSVSWTHSRAIPLLDHEGEIIEWFGTASNITEQKRAIESAERLKILMDHNPSLVFMKDEDGRYVYLNKAYEETFVLSSDWLGKTDLDFWPRESAELFRANDVDVMASGRIQQFLEDSTDLNGNRHCWICYKFPFTDSQGRRYLAGIGMDAVDRVVAEEALRESEERLRVLGDNLPDSAVYQYTHEPDGSPRFLYISAGIERIIGVKPEDVVRDARTLHSRILPESFEDLAKLERISAENLTDFDMETRMLRADGEVRWMHLHSRPRKLDDGQVIWEGVQTDITDQKTAERALRDSEEQFRAIFEQTGVGIGAVDRSGRLLKANRAFEEMLGYSAGELLGKTIAEITHPDDWALESVATSQALEGKIEKSELEKRYIRKDGEIIWCRISVTVLPERAGQDMFSIAVVEDITERKKAEGALRQSEEHFRALTHNLSSGVALIDEYGQFAIVNPAFLRMFGLDENCDISNVNDTKWSEWQVFDPNGQLLDVDDHPVRRAAITRKAVTDVLVGVLPPSASEATWMLVTAEPLVKPDGQPHAIICTYQDVTQLKQADEELRRSKELLQAIIDNTPALVYVFDAEHRFIIGNESLAALLGSTPEKLVGRQRREFMPDEAASQHEGNERQVLQDGDALTFEEDGMIGGRHITWLTNKFPIRDSNGNIYGVAGISADISERKRAEQRQRELFEREQHIVEVLQQAIVPSEIAPELLGYRIAVGYRSGSKEAEIGGDFYDVFELDENRLGIVIGDVAGKGLLAALRVASARHAIRSYAYLDPRPARVLTYANEALCREGGDVSQILTVFFAILDAGAGLLTYSSAGHEPPVVCHGGSCEELQGTGLPLGLMPGAEYPHFSRRLDPGETIVMVTDGITEARAPGPVLFGKERLVALLQEHPSASPESLVGIIIGAATGHAGELQDDAAIVVLTPSAGKVGAP